MSSHLKPTGNARAEGARALRDSPQFVKGVGPARARKLERLGILTLADLLFYFPRKYLDRSEVVSICDAPLDAQVTLCGTVIKRVRRKPRGRAGLTQVTLRDNTGEVQATWFNQPWMFDQFKEGQTVLVWGKLTFYQSLQIANPEFEFLDDADAGDFSGTLPIYSLTEGLSQKQLRTILAHALESHAPAVEEIFNPATRKKKKLLGIAAALRTIHFPDSPAALAKAIRRFKYEELFLLELGMALRRRALKAGQQGRKVKITQAIDQRIRRLFPFDFTAAQERAIDQIQTDLADPSPMNRLVHGDVGCGKTAVAVYAMLAAVANKLQVAFMAPTAILAEQHYQTIGSYLEKARVRTALLTGGLRKKERAALIRDIQKGQYDIIVGTHALIQQDVDFHNLGLVIVDEQHKFGVVQRGILREKGLSPDVLVMTATPIPRTLSLTVFGDLDVTQIDELPPGRGKVETFVADNTDRDRREKMLAFVERKLAEGQQAFFVYPRVEESEDSTSDLKNATTMAKALASGPLGRHGVQLLHGQMKEKEKTQIVAAFHEKEFRVLVATIVIEVGLDIPNATVMVIENAERFGLAQLHQLRGRIGRGSQKSFCILLGDTTSEEASRRLEVLENTTDGFKIAEEDLRMRGPGQFFGTRQHGLPELKIANLIDDYELLVATRKDAFRLVENDPGLSQPAVQPIRRTVFDKYGAVLELVDVG